MGSKVTCKICKNKFDILNTHLRRVHRMKAEDYLIKYPNAKTVSDDHKKKLSQTVREAGVNYSLLAGKRTFDFIKDVRLKRLLQRDYKTAKVCLKNKQWKPSIIIYASIIEAILREVTKSKSLKFYDVLEKSFKKEIITEKEYHKIHIVRDIRNLVHLHKELSEGEEINEHWANTLADICESIIKRFRK